MYKSAEMDGNAQDKLIYTHDSFFKGAFSYPDVAAGYIRSYLPPELTAQLGLNRLELSNSSYVTNELRNYFSDLVWICPIDS